MNDSTQGSKVRRRGHLRSVPDMVPDISRTRSGSGDLSLGTSIADRCMKLKNRLDNHFSADPEGLYASSYDIAREIFTNDALDWSEDASDLAWVLSNAPTAQVSYEVNDGRSVIDSVDSVIDNVIEDTTIPEVLAKHGIEILMSRRDLRTLMFMTLQTHTLARDTYILMSAWADNQQEGIDVSAQPTIKAMLLDYQTHDFGEINLQNLTQFMVGYSRIVVEKFAQNLGYDEAVARRLAAAVALDVLKMEILDEEDPTIIQEMSDDWVKSELERKAVALSKVLSDGKGRESQQNRPETGTTVIQLARFARRRAHTDPEG